MPKERKREEKLEKLALHGGPKAVTLDDRIAQRWPIITDEEIELVTYLMRKGEISTSPIVAEFEKDFARYHGVKYALAQNNGTSTLHAAYFAVGVGPGDEVITPAYSWHLQATSILATNGIPVFCDIEPKTLSIDPKEIEKKITPQTKAIAVLHPFGHPAEMDEIMNIARSHGIPVIEDASHAHGATYKGRKMGTLGDIGCFSLQGSKLMVAGEGGILITNNTEYYERAVTLGHYERIPSLTMEKYRKYYPDYPKPPACFGFKYRIHPLAAAMAKVQLKYLDQRNQVRKRNLDYLTKGLTGIRGIEPPYTAPYATVYWLNYLARYHAEELKGVPRDRFIEALRAEGVSAYSGRVGYLPLHWNPLFQEREFYGKGCPFDCPHAKRKVLYKIGDYPVAEQMYTKLIGLSTFPNPCERELLDQYIEAFQKVVSNVDQLL